MTNKKISELTKTTTVENNDVFPIVTDGETITKKIEANDLIKQTLQQSGVKDLILSLLGNELTQLTLSSNPVGTIVPWHKNIKPGNEFEDTTTYQTPATGGANILKVYEANEIMSASISAGSILTWYLTARKVNVAGSTGNVSAIIYVNNTDTLNGNETLLASFSLGNTSNNIFSSSFPKDAWDANSYFIIVGTTTWGPNNRNRLIIDNQVFTDTFVALPPNWVECNGQILSDNDSILDGSTIPNLNGVNRFIRGNSVSGETGGAASHSHTLSRQLQGSGASFQVVTATDTGVSSSLPPYINMVWIMRVK